MQPWESGQHEAALREAVSVVRRGGVVVYPTETLYGIGCDARDEVAVERIARIKGRPEGKPLPLVIGNMRQLAQVTTAPPEALTLLAELFWPGPLSVLVPARFELAPGVSDAQGLTSLRWTAHPLAAELSHQAECPLAATSANLAGHFPAALPEELDPAVTSACDAVLFGPPLPGGGLPSTVVRPLGLRLLEVVRPGAVGLDRLRAAGFELRGQVS